MGTGDWGAGREDKFSAAEGNLSPRGVVLIGNVHCTPLWPVLSVQCSLAEVTAL